MVAARKRLDMGQYKIAAALFDALVQTALELPVDR